MTAPPSKPPHALVQGIRAGGRLPSSQSGRTDVLLSAQAPGPPDPAEQHQPSSVSFRPSSARQLQLASAFNSKPSRERSERRRSGLTGSHGSGCPPGEPPLDSRGLDGHGWTATPRPLVRKGRLTHHQDALRLDPGVHCGVDVIYRDACTKATAQPDACKQAAICTEENHHH